MIPQIGKIYICLPPLKPGKAVVVDLFAKGVVPDPRLVNKYYVPTKASPIGTAPYKQSSVDRWIFKRVDSEGYIIIPDTWRLPTLLEEDK